MAASKGGINLCRIFFYKLHTIGAERQEGLVSLAYQTARDKLLAPKEIIIRSDLHDVTAGEDGHAEDPRGFHGTIAFKGSEHVEREFHVTSHGYTNGKEDFVLTEATHTEEKPDDTIRSMKLTRKGDLIEKVVWPKKEDLVEYKGSPIGYSHLPDDHDSLKEPSKAVNKYFIDKLLSPEKQKTTKEPKNDGDKKSILDQVAWPKKKETPENLTKKGSKESILDRAPSPKEKETPKKLTKKGSKESIPDRAPSPKKKGP